MTAPDEFEEHDDHREDDFLAFWDQHHPAASETTRILGVDVIVPTDLPLAVEDMSERLKHSTRAEDFEQLLEILFGEDVYDQWKARGLTAGQLRVLVAWGMANASGKPTSFAEAAELVAAAEAEQEAGKALAPNRADRRAASSRTRGSGAAGHYSSPISGANTRSILETFRT